MSTFVPIAPTFAAGAHRPRRRDLPRSRSVSTRTTASRARPRCRSERRGASIVEFALIAPLFFLLVFGIIEFGRALMVQQILTNASREGGRRAIVEGASSSEVQGVIEDYLANTSVSNASVSVSPTSLQTVGFGDAVVVTVSIPFDNVSWSGTPWFLGSQTLTATTVMRGERLQ